MIFITLGSQKFQFDRLLKAIDQMIEHGNIEEKVFAQIGCSTYLPKHYEYEKFLNRDEFMNMQEKADLFITHAGTGAIIGALKKGKKVIAIPRLAKYGEHVDDHQIQIVQQFEMMKVIEPCYHVSDLQIAMENVKTKCYVPFYSNTEKFIRDIDDFLEAL